MVIFLIELARYLGVRAESYLPISQTEVFADTKGTLCQQAVHKGDIPHEVRSSFRLAVTFQMIYLTASSSILSLKFTVSLYRCFVVARISSVNRSILYWDDSKADSQRFGKQQQYMLENPCTNKSEPAVQCRLSNLETHTKVPYVLMKKKKR